MIDIHCHILHALDDGPHHLDASLQMAQDAAAQGVTVIVATPHCSSDPGSLTADRITERTDDFIEHVAARAPGLRIVPGGEIFLDPGVPEMIAAGTLPAFGAAGKHVLVELPRLYVPSWTADVLFNIIARGFVPVLAHPERNHELSQRLDLLFDYITTGCLLQVTAGSLVGAYGPIAEEAAWRIIDHDICHFLASDAHSPTAYREVLPRAIEAARQRLGDERSDALFTRNPGAVLNGAELSVPEPRRPESPRGGGGKRGFFGLFGGRRQ